MPPAAHRLTLLLLPMDPDRPGSVAVELYERLQRGGWIGPDGGPGPRPLVEGGFARARPEVFDRTRFASSGQGGFSVRCPVDGSNVVAPFSSALEAWRVGGPRHVACGCGREHDLVDLVYSPEAGFARGWLAVIDVQGIELDAEARAEAEVLFEGVRIVVRRG